ncbi:MAG: DUF6390 family protein [bacterium]|nr:DUF6390 family protein [bacterium]
MNKQGLLLCARYSVAPNFFGYCGPDNNLNLVDHLKDNIVDKEISVILSQFDTLFSYLRLIAKDNNIKDNFDKQVVESYWIGNKLLENINKDHYSSLLIENFDLENKIGYEKSNKIISKIKSNHIYPHHSFHVFNIFKRTGHDPSFHTLNTMDQCRIGWGRIQIKSEKLKVKSLLVKTRQLVIKKNKLTFGELINKELRIDYKGKSFHDNFKVGDWVSYHWGFVCDVLTQNQVKYLKYFTEQSIKYFNQTNP